MKEINEQKLGYAIPFAIFLVTASLMAKAAVSQGSRFFLKDEELITDILETGVWSLTFSYRFKPPELTIDNELLEAELWIESSLQPYAEGMQEVDVDLIFLDEAGKVLSVIEYWEIKDFNVRSLHHEATIAAPPEADSITFKTSTRGGRPTLDNGRFPGRR